MTRPVLLALGALMFAGASAWSMGGVRVFRDHDALAGATILVSGAVMWLIAVGMLVDGGAWA